MNSERDLPSEEARRAWAALESVMDPEVPVLSIVELGIVRDVKVLDNRVSVTITPTYSGCPAMHAIETELTAALLGAGFEGVELRTVYAPAWTTDWIGEPAKAKLREYGIAPPGRAAEPQLVALGPVARRVSCPFCGSPNTILESEFGATACKGLYSCRACRQPFEHFKSF